jgi:hypothetical protein
MREDSDIDEHIHHRLPGVRKIESAGPPHRKNEADNGAARATEGRMESFRNESHWW